MLDSAQLEQEIAALVHFVEPYVSKCYFRELPEGFATPSVFFPPPEVDGVEHSLSAYANEFALFMKVFDRDSIGAYAVASKIVEDIQNHRKRIPLYDEKGEITGKNFRVTKLNAKIIDVGVAQIAVEWKTLTAYDEEIYTKAKDFYYSGLATSKVKEELDGTESG